MVQPLSRWISEKLPPLIWRMNRLLTAVVAVVPALAGWSSLGYGVFAGLLGAVFLYCSIAVWRMPDGDQKMVPAKKMFAFSILYLFAIFSALMIDAFMAPLLSLIGGAA